MERLSTLVVGWVFVGCGALLLVAIVGRAALGHVAGGYERPVVIALGALMLLIGLAILIRHPPRWLPVVAVVGCGVFLTGFGIFALVLSGSATLVAARSVAHRGRRGPAPRNREDDRTGVAPRRPADAGVRR